MTNEERAIVASCAIEVFGGQTIRQHPPKCLCGIVLNEEEIYDCPGVFFEEVKVFGRVITLIEPICPNCGKRIVAVWDELE
jgi:hypothetical protein